MKRKSENDLSIIDLPVEIIALIASFLEKKDFYRFRRVCHSFKDALKHDLIKQLEESKIQKIYAKGHHSFFVTKKGKVFGCGNNQFFQLGIDNILLESNPNRLTHIDSLHNITEITGSSTYTIFKENPNILYGCGYIIPHGNSAIPLYPPTQLYSLPNDLSIIFGNTHMFMFLPQKSDNTVSGYGSNDKGQLGLGDIESCSTFTSIPISDVSDIITGEENTFFTKKSDRTLWGCGNNKDGQLGLGDNPLCKIPVPISNLTNVIKIVSINGHTLFLHQNGTVSACGLNFHGEICLKKDRYNKPTLIPKLRNVVDIATGNYHSLFLKKKGTVLACGWNANGQLGLENTEFCTKPTLIPHLTDVINISAGLHHSLFLTKNNLVFVCGDNAFGQLGLNHYNSVTTPTPVPSLNYWKKPMESIENNVNLSLIHETKKTKFNN